MCGVFGTVSPGPLRDPGFLLDALTDRLQHRGPDGRGNYRDANAYLGHRRLAVIDRQVGQQPMRSACGRYVISYNGEIYNFRQIRDRLRHRNHVFRTECDTEVVLQAFAEWGIDCVGQLNGIFAFAVWDREQRELWLVRDRLGVKPLYYTFLEGRILFASEMKALTAHPGFARTANLEALSSYLTFRTVVGSATVFDGISSLPAGTCLHYNNGTVDLHRYWDVPCPAERPDLGEKYYLTRTAELLRAAVARQMVSDVPVGAYLSGGVDSSLLVALMREVTQEPPKTYSIGFDVNGYDEGDYAKRASLHIGTDHRHFVLNLEDYTDALEDLVRHRDQPLSIPHEVALFQLSKQLKQDVTVCLSGEGADELFGGYGRVQGSPFDFARLRLFQKLPAPIKNLAASMVRDPDLKARLSISDELAHFFHVYNWWSFDDKQALFSADARAEIGGDRALKQQFQEAFSRFDDCTAHDRIFYVFEKMHLVNLLGRLDVQSMAASVEARVPFTDHELVEFVSAIPVQYKIRWNSRFDMLRALFYKNAASSERFDTTKYLLRRLADEKLPPSIARRKKLGFPVPLDTWFGASLKSHAAAILLDDQTRRRGLFDSAHIERLLKDCGQSAYDTHGKKIWMLMNIELWFRNHIDVQSQISREVSSA